MKKQKHMLFICIASLLLTGAFAETPVYAAAAAEAETEIVREGQLTLKDISAFNEGAEIICSHDDRVTFIEGTCTESPVTGGEDAAVVVDSVMNLIGADANTEFVLWRTISDPSGNVYYIFQQIYQNTTVCGGAVKVITDSEGNMIGLTSSVESEMPDVDPGTGLTAEEAEQIVLEKELADSGRILRILGQFTDKVILPSSLKFDVEDEDSSSRFAWVVYSENPSGNVQTSSDLPYLAHYVSMAGEYLYSMPAITPDDEAGRAGYDAGYVFEFMEPAEYTGYVDLSDGSEKEISVTVMRDRRTGMYYLGNIERRIIVAECYDFLYDDGRVVLEASPDNLEWDQVGLLSLYNYCRVWDYYNEIGWTGGDGRNTPIIILNNFCDDHYNEVNNACYVGMIYGMQVFLASKINDFSQCLDIIAHEFTHCVTGSLMTYNSYMNDYGAINEAISDIQGKNCEMMAGDAETDDWILGSHSESPVRSMSDPHLFTQPEYTWDLYYQAKVVTPTGSNDHGGVHFNSSLLNHIAYLLVSDGGMTLEEARIFWFMTDCAMVPGTDYAQLSELLPWVLKRAGMEQYAETLAKAVSETRLGADTMPETFDDDRALIKLSLPDTEAFDGSNWLMALTSIKVDGLIGRVKTIVSQLLNKDYSELPESLQKVIAEEEEEAVSVSEEEKERVTDDLIKWFRDELRQNIFSSYGFAGQDGSTVNMVVRPGRSIPQLYHATYAEGSQEPDQIVMAAYIHGRWYVLPEIDTENPDNQENNEEAMSDLMSGILDDIFGEGPEVLQNIHSLDDVLDLFTVNIKGGEILELSSEGLESIVIPDPVPPEEKTYGTIEPGKKSRPKTAAESAAEEVIPDAAA